MTARPTRVAFVTLGCKVNFVDTQVLEESIDPRRFRQVAFDEEAEVYVVNTCTVTAAADAQARNLIRRAKRRNPRAAVVVTGCYATRQAGDLGRMEEIDRVLAREEQRFLPRVLEELAAAHPAPVAAEPAAAVPRRHRPVVKIQEGCDLYCSFCVVPYTRGSELRSMPPAQVREELERLEFRGAREVVLTGTHLGGYGVDLRPATSLARLLGDLAGRTWRLRIRVSSIQPTHLGDDLLEVLLGSPLFCRHLHIPVQSGDDQMLERMNRPYSAGRFRELIEGIARRLSGIGLGTDIVVGHPGEDPSASTRTRELLRSLPLSYLHVFPFSPRPGTRAAQLEGRIPPSEAKRRCAELRVIDAEKRDGFWHSQLGSELDVLLEVPAEGRAGFWKGHTDNYLRVLVPLDAGKDGDLVRVRLVEGPMGEPLGIPPPRGASC